MKRPTKPPFAAKEPGKNYQLKIELEGVSPPIWRRVLVPGNISLSRLHAVIQLVMGWDNALMHRIVCWQACAHRQTSGDRYR